MKVRMLQSIRGPGISLDPGDMHEGSAEEMARWCQKGIAAPVRTTKRRKAVKDAPDKGVTE